MVDQARGSQAQGSRKKRESKLPKQSPKGKPLASTFALKRIKKASKLLGPGELNYVDLLSNVPQTLRPDYKAVSIVYKKYSKSCMDAYIFKVDEKKEVSITQLIEVPVEFKIRVKEDQLMEEMINYLVNILDKSMK